MHLFHNEKNHGVLLAGATLLLEILRADPSAAKRLYVLVPFTVKLLRKLSSTDYVPEYDVGGVNDPFLQTKLLRLLRELGPTYVERGEAKIAGVLKDTLAQVATNTESARNVGNAVLYECIQAIIALGKDSSLLVLATNLLGRFLKHKDNNIRYVALNTMQTVLSVSADGAAAVQRHRQTIVDCLRDPDISIRRRALDLVYALVCPSNVRQLTRELLSYLVIADKEFRENIVAKLCWLIERYAPSPRWQFDTTIRVISLAASSAVVPDDVPAAICAIVSQTPPLQAYAVQRLYAALVKEIAHPDLAKIGLWCMGEFGDLLIGSPAKIADEDAEDAAEDNSNSGDHEGNDGHSIASMGQVVDLIEGMLVYPYNRGGSIIREYGVSTLAKLCCRFESVGGPEAAETCARIKRILAKFAKDINVEIQQRSVEFLNIDKLHNNSIKNDVFDKMPPIENDTLVEGDDAIGTSAPSTSPVAPSDPVNILDQIMGSSATPADAAPKQSTPTPAAPSASSGSAADLLADIFGGGAGGAPAVNVASSSNVASLLDSTPMSNATLPASADSLLSTLPSQPFQPSQPSQPQPQTSLLDITPSIPTPAPAPAPAPVVPQPQAPILGLEKKKDEEVSASDDGKMVPVYDKDGVNVVMRAKNPNGDISLTRVVTTFTSKNVGCDVSDLLMRVAVPKWLKLELEPADGSSLKGGDPESKVTQILKLINNSDGAKPTLIRVKITFKTASGAVDEMVEVHL